MSAQGLRYRLFDLGQRAVSAWRWWLREMAALLPESVRRALAAGDPIIAIDLKDDAVVIRRFAEDCETEIARLPRATFDAAMLRGVLAPYLAKPWFRREDFALRLADSSALRRTLALPLAAQRAISQVLEHELERQSPLDRGEVYHDYKIRGIDRRAGRIELVWRIARRGPVDAAHAICREAGIDLAVIAFIGDETPPDGGTFPIDSRAFARLRARRWVMPGLFALVAALAIAVIAAAYARNQDIADALTAQADQTRIAADVSRHLQGEIADTRRRAAFLSTRKQGLMATNLIAEVTRVLPAGSWLTQLEYRDGDVLIQGVSNAPATLIALFDASPLFADAQFRAPLMQVPGGQERFDMALRIRKGAR